MQLKMFYHFRSFFLPLTFLFKILFQKLFLLICKVSLSAYNWTSTTVSLLAGWGNWVILPSISIVICYFFLIQTSIFFTFRKTITVYGSFYRFMVYLEGDNSDHLAMFVPHQAQSEVLIIDSLMFLKVFISNFYENLCV